MANRKSGHSGDSSEREKEEKDENEDPVQKSKDEDAGGPSGERDLRTPSLLDGGEWSQGEEHPSDPDDDGGAVLGEKYRITGEIGRGGMGAVLEGKDIDLRRQLAIKTLYHEGDVDPARVTRFIEEAQVQGQLQHPNICPVYELGMDAEGQLFFTMKNVSGRTLQERINHPGEDGEHSLTELLDIFRKFVTGLHTHIHGALFIGISSRKIL